MLQENQIAKRYLTLGAIAANRKLRMAAIMMMACGLIAAMPADKCSAVARAISDPGTRVLHFPADRVIGKLSVESPRDASSPPGSDAEDLPQDSDWDFIALARGDVVVPTERNIQLHINLKPGPDDLSWIAQLAPSDLYELHVGSWEDRGPANRARLEAISHLTGLQVLRLSNTGFTAPQMSALKSLPSLRSLTLYNELRIRSDAIAMLKDFPALESLECWGVPTDADVKQIAQMPNLRRLTLRMDAISGYGLAHLAGSPRLEYLKLWGAGSLTDQHVRYLEAVKGLKSLVLWCAPALSDASLASISKLTTLEKLYVKSNQTNSTHFTDAGMAHLKTLKNLKDITLHGARISGVGVRHLAALPRLEAIEGVGFGSDALKDLASCRNLKRLHVSFKRRSDQPGDRINPADVAHVAALNRLEKLAVSCKDSSDEDLARLEPLTNVTHLTLLLAEDITERGWASIGKLRRLEDLRFYGDVKKKYVTKRGLNHLNALTNLQRLEVRMNSKQAPVMDNTQLNLGALTNLKTVELIGLTLQESDLACLRGLKNLKWLRLQNYGMLSENVLTYVRNAYKLETLHIVGITCTEGTGLAHLGGLKTLGHITLTGRITDSALGRLTGPISLWGLDITTDAPIRTETVTRLRQNFPGVRTVNIQQPQQQQQQQRPPMPRTTTTRRRR